MYYGFFPDQNQESLEIYTAVANSEDGFLIPGPKLVYSRGNMHVGSYSLRHNLIIILRICQNLRILEFFNCTCILNK